MLCDQYGACTCVMLPSFFGTFDLMTATLRNELVRCVEACGCRQLHEVVVQQLRGWKVSRHALPACRKLMVDMSSLRGCVADLPPQEAGTDVPPAWK